MDRPSLAARVPQLLLPTTTEDGQQSDVQSQMDSQSSLDSELQGLTLSPPRNAGFGRSSSNPLAQPQPAAGAPLHRSATGLASKPAGPVPSIQLHVDATVGGRSNEHHIQRERVPAAVPPQQLPQLAAGSVPPTAQVAAVERLGSRLGQQQESRAGPSLSHTDVAESHPAAPSLGTLANSTPASWHGSNRSRSTQREAHPGFGDEISEDEGASQGPGSPASIAATSTATGSVAGARSAPAAASLERGRVPSRSPSTRSPSRTNSRQGYMATTIAAERKHTAAEDFRRRPNSASPTKHRPGTSTLTLEARVEQQLERDPADWTVTEVCDWLELIGLGQYRRRFVHNAVSGMLLLRLTNEELKTEVGIGPLGHRSALLTAINDLEHFWQQQQQERQLRHQLVVGPASSQDGSCDTASSCGGDDASSCHNSGGGGSGSRSPAARLSDYSQQKAFELRQRLAKKLEKAEAREAKRKKVAEQALHVAAQASDEIHKLQASIWELDRQLGRQSLGEHFDPVDVHGHTAWQPAGKQRVERPGFGSPARGAAGSRSAGASPMSAASRRIMEGHGGGSGGGGFLERLSRDLEARQAKAAEAARRAGRYQGGAMEQQVQQEARDLRLLRETVEARNTDLAEALASGDPGRVGEACDEMAQSYQKELGLSQEAVEAVHAAASVSKKVARLAAALRSGQFMARLQQDLSTREERLQELQQRYFKLEHGNTAEQQEKADLAAAQAHFGLLGWRSTDLDVAPSDSSAPCDSLLNALLRRAAALQEAQQQGKPVPDWDQLQWKSDRLADLQAEHNSRLQAILDECKAAAERVGAGAGAAGAKRIPIRSPSRSRDLQQPGNHMQETVELLAACRLGEMALLEGLAGYRKLMMTWRAVRAQQFIAFTKQDLQQRQAKAAALEKQLYPDNTKVLPKEEFNKFFDRLMSDTARRVQHRDELAEAAKAEALAKLMRTAPRPPSQLRRPASAQR